ncbi:hypothetical protein MYX64_05885 [Nitrospinae bacterium AH_259_B05_G02_I21]|nr:hypothetical protein [Nitrospinae bacterium AH_259_B05_G02_I21]
MIEEVPDWLRWVLVLPLAVGAWIGSQAIIMILGNFFSQGLGLWNLGIWVVTVGAAVAAPYGFVWVGALAAPRYSFRVAVILTAIHALGAMTILVMVLGTKHLNAPVWWVITGNGVGILATLGACAQFREKRPKINDIPLPS